MSTLSPNMTLPISTIGVDTGLAWETNLNSALTIIDQHTHASGYGVQIQPNGLNINTDLTIQGNSLTTVKSVRFQAQVSPIAGTSPNIGCLYVSSNDLYYNDTAGNQVRITASGAVNATTSGISSGTATAAFSAGILVVQSAALTSAPIDAGSIILRNATASSFGLTLSPPNAMAADYTLVLPAIPSASGKSFMTLDNTGNMAAPWQVDNSSLEVTTTTLRVKAGGITNAMLAGSIDAATKLVSASITQTQMASNSIGTSQLVNGNVTPIKRSAAIAGVSSTSSATGISAGSSIPNTITSVGRPVLINVSIGGLTNSNAAGDMAAVTTSVSNYIAIFKNGIELVKIMSSSGAVTIPFSGFTYIDTSPYTGAVTYDVRTNGGTAGPSQGSSTVTMYLNVTEL